MARSSMLFTLIVFLSAAGARAAEPPAQPVTFPSTSKTFSTYVEQSLIAPGAKTCAATDALLKKAADPAMKPELARAIREEGKVARVLCDEKGTFRGYTGVKGRNETFLVNEQALTDTLFRVWQLTRQVDPIEATVIYNSYRRLDENRRLFVIPALRDMYFFLTATEISDLYSRLTHWANELNRWHRLHR